MILALASLVAIGYLPGALIYRLPLADRPRRAALPADERAVLGRHHQLARSRRSSRSRWRRAGAVHVPAPARCRPRPGRAPDCGGAREARDTTPAARAVLDRSSLPAALIALGAYLFFPSSEYVMGGKDPGTYMNEGIQIAQRGSLAIHDPALAAVPEEFRSMFLSGAPEEIEQGLHQGVRFMGFFVADRSRGEVMGQFPHAFPVVDCHRVRPRRPERAPGAPSAPGPSSGCSRSTSPARDSPGARRPSSPPCCSASTWPRSGTRGIPIPR